MLAESMAVADPNNRRAQADHAIALTRLGNVIARENSQEAISIYRRALELFRATAASDPNNLNVAMNMAHLFQMMGERKMEGGDLPGAAGSLRDARQLSRHILGRKPGESATERVFILVLAIEVNLLVRMERRAEALARAHEAVAFAARKEQARTAFQSDRKSVV